MTSLYGIRPYGMCLMFLMLLLFVGACQAPPSTPAPGPLTDQEREALVIEKFQPVIDHLKTAINDKNAGITPFTKEGNEYEPRVSRYLVPLLIDRLVREGIALIERRDLDEVVTELERQMSDLIDEGTTVEVGMISGVELLVLGRVKDLTRTVYRIEIKLVDLETAKIVLAESIDLPRELLPIKFGGV
ncbi:MAG: CsgG/HfaB family protein [Planctomycetes bacterium]|nr:CsgG/HfaB family protein [Planctomycetota bacterium]